MKYLFFYLCLYVRDYYYLCLFVRDYYYLCLYVRDYFSMCAITFGPAAHSGPSSRFSLAACTPGRGGSRAFPPPPFRGYKTSKVVGCPPAA